jgi:diketogulonate reductase-like aldo/keto reductase
MKENFEVFDFELNDEDIQEIKSIDKKISYTNWPEAMLREQNY